MTYDQLQHHRSSSRNSRVRKYYTLTSAGRAAARDRVQEFAQFVETMKTLLSLNPDTRTS